MATDETVARRFLHVVVPDEDDPVARINAMLDRATPGRSLAQARDELHQEWLEFGGHHWLWQIWQQMLRRAPGQCG